MGRAAWKFAGWLGRFTSGVVSWFVWLIFAAFLVTVVVASAVCCGRDDPVDNPEEW